MKIARRSLFQGIGAVLLARAALKFPVAAKVAEAVVPPIRLFINGVEMQVGRIEVKLDEKKVFYWSKPISPAKLGDTLVWKAREGEWAPRRSMHDDLLDFFYEGKS